MRSVSIISHMWPVIVEIPLPFAILGHESIPIRGFGLMVVLALLAGNAYATRVARKRGISDEITSGLFLAIMIAIVVGARLMYVIVNWSEYASDPSSILAVQKGGMVYYGSFLGVIVALVWMARRHGIKVLELTDIYAPAAALGMSIGRIGCLLVGDDYGKRVSESYPLAIKFPSPNEDGSLFGLRIPADNGNLAGPMQGEWLHPTQLYMSFNALVLFFVLRALWRRRRFRGQITAAFFLYYAVTRSLIEVFRGDPRGNVGPLSTSQFVSIFVFLAGLVLWLWARRRGALADQCASDQLRPTPMSTTSGTERS